MLFAADAVGSDDFTTRGVKCWTWCEHKHKLWDLPPWPLYFDAASSGYSIIRCLFSLYYLKPTSHTVAIIPFLSGAVGHSLAPVSPFQRLRRLRPERSRLLLADSHCLLGAALCVKQNV